MSRREPYAKSTPEFRAEVLEALMCPDSGWPKDWEDRLGLDAKGSIIWQVNAADVMLLVREIERLRKALADAELHSDAIPGRP